MVSVLPAFFQGRWGSMEWEFRCTDRYFYLTPKPDGQTKKRNQGKRRRSQSGSIRQQKGLSDRNQLKDELELYRAEDWIVDQFSRIVSELAEARLFSAGFYNSQGRGWKKMRKKAQTTPFELPQPHSTVPDLDRLSELVEAVRNGDRNVLPELQAMVSNYPDIGSNYRDLGIKCQMIWARMAETEVYMRERLLARVRDLKFRLKAEGYGSELEDLLIDLVAMTWLQSHHFKLRVLSDRASTIKIEEHRMRRLKGIIKQHLKAYDLLATVRTKLQLK